MLSRFSHSGLPRCMVVRIQSASSKPPDVPAKNESSKRDLVNFPRREITIRPPDTRFGFIPDTWFQFFYPKTGVTGPYMLMIGVSTYLLSKEIVPIEHNFVHGLSFIMACYMVQTNYGDSIRNYFYNQIEEQAKSMDAEQENEKQECADIIALYEKYGNIKASMTELGKARMENAQLQIEAAYRDRMVEAHKKVKSRLDCMIELANVENRITHKNLMDYVLKNVMKSITPELENAAMQSCISSLNTLSSKA